MQKLMAIILSGRIFVAGSLLQDRPELALPELTKVGDVRIIAVRDGIRGFFSATIYDGKHWRRLLLRSEAQGPATYVDQAERSERLSCVLSTLVKLSGHEASHTTGGYVVKPVKASAVPVLPPSNATLANTDWMNAKPEPKLPDATQLPLF